MMSDIPFTPGQLVIAALVVVLLVVGGVLGYRHWRRADARRKRMQHLSAAAFDLVHDVLVPDGSDGHLHIDCLLLTAAGLMVVDLRDVPGMIFGSESMDEWTAMDGVHRHTFPNPLGPLYDRMAAVKLLAGRTPVDGRVVFSSRGSFPKGRPPRVTLLESLGEELGVADRKLQPSPVAGWSDEWATVKAALAPSPHRRKS